MQRNTYIEKLLAWKRSARRKPLILEGARQVGKTWLMREFAKTNYKSAVYARFDKDALTEQYVHQQLLAESGLEPCYWSTEDSRTEIDFVFAHGGEVFPLEVKSGGNVRSQSLKSYIAKFRPEIAFRASLLPFAEQTVPVEGRAPCRLFNVPLWAVGQCQKLTRALPPVEGAN